MNNRAALFEQNIQCSSSTVMVMMSSMKPCIDSSVAVISTDKGTAVAIWLAESCFSSYGSKYWCGKFRSSVSQYSSQSRSLPRSIAPSLTVLYYAGAGVVPKVNLKQRKSSSSTIAMHVDTVVAFACIRRLAASRSVFPISITFVGHLIRIVEIMCRILSRQKP